MFSSRWFRGLRPRLTLSYVLFFTVLLSFLGIFFSETIRAIFRTQTHDLLAEEWGTVHGYLRIEKNNEPLWFYDPHDPDESFTVERLRRVLLLTDASGKVIQDSSIYRDIGIDSPQEIRRVIASGAQTFSIRSSRSGGGDYMTLSGVMVENNQPYYLSIGRSLAESDHIADQFTRNYFLFLPVMIAMGSIFGWFMAARALQPLDELANTAQRITGSNLSGHIPPRGVDDELDRLIESFNRMIERLDASFQQTRQFSTDVSHELRTPLTAIRGQLEVAMFAATTVEQYRDAIVEALQDVDRLSQTIRALLLLSQAESGQLALQKQRLDLVQITSDIVDQFRIPAEDARVDLAVELPPECPIDADRIQIERLISNLLSNAVKYTPAGGQVTVSVNCTPEAAELAISDTGMGIAADHLPHIFDRFYRVPSADRNPERGLGLGLSFVAWIVKAHGGRVDVKSKLGRGTTFHIWLPASSTPVPTPVHASSTGGASPLE